MAFSRKIFLAALVLIVMGFCLQFVFSPAKNDSPNHRHKKCLTRPLNGADDKFVPLTEVQINGVKKFVYFVGYARSGHSIIGSMMDAHPEMIIANKYRMTGKNDSILNTQDRSKSALFNNLYENSYKHTHCGLRSTTSDKKGYTLEVPGTWQGRFQSLKVIGNKLGGATTFKYAADPKGMQKFFYFVRRIVKVPMAEIYVVRNPFDIISTVVLYTGHTMEYGGKGTRMEASADNKYNNIELLKKSIGEFFRLAHTLKEMIKTCSLDNLLMIHIEEFIRDPKPVLRKICDHLELECPSDYVQQCYDKAFRQVSRSRDTVYWPLELRESVMKQMLEFPELAGYSFEEDYYNLTQNII